MIVAILIGERDEEVGRTSVPPTAVLIKHCDEFYVKTSEAKRLTLRGTAMGAIFRLADVYERRALTTTKRAPL